MGEPRGDDNVRDIGKARPFQQSANRYLSAGWWPITVKYGEKNPPRTGYTGRICEWPDEEKIAEWIEEQNWNVAFHLGPVPPPSERGMSNRDPEWSSQKWTDDDGNPTWTVVGIDVDDYEDGGKTKTGYEQLLELEKELGKLPETWTSSSRNDGKSGIKYFLAPAEYAFKDGIAQHIDVIQQTHRYAMVWPSLHPSGGQYTWFGPGQAPQGQGAQGYAAQAARRHKSGGVSQLRFVQQEVVPLVWTLPLLPEPWVERLTEGYMRHEGHAIDMDSSVDEVWEWAEKHFNQDPEGEYCQRMRKRVEAWKHDILEDATSHDKIRDAHWNILCNGSEGHPGWIKALDEIEAFWLEDVVKKRGKRALGEANGEMFRSRTNALRKIKAAVKEGSRGLISQCPCYVGKPLEGNEEFQPNGIVKDPAEYTRNHRGNAEHFIDLFGGPKDGRWKYANDALGWIYWDDERWTKADGNKAARAFYFVEQNQQQYAEHLLEVWAKAKAEDDPRAQKFWNDYSKWDAHALKAGNSDMIENSLKLAKTLRYVTLDDESQPDMNISLLGTPNGVIELADATDGDNFTLKEFTFRPYRKEDMILTTTAVPFVPRQEQRTPEMIKGQELWANYLQMFLPDPEKRAWVQQVLGYTLFGRNIKKLAVFLYGRTGTGKSTILDAISAALGGYAGPFEMNMFKPDGEFNPQLVASMRKRFITTTETGGNKSVSSDMIKRITGNDEMASNVKNSMDVVRGIPAFVPVFGTNTPPQVDMNDPGLQGRLEIIEFDTQAPNTSAEGLKVVTHAREAVLLWLLEGWNLFVKHDMQNRPDSMKEARSEFITQMSGPIGTFVADCLDVTNDKDDVMSTDEIYALFEWWAKDNRFKDIPNKNTFGFQLTKYAGLAPARVSRTYIPGKQSKVRTGVRPKEGIDPSDVRKFRMQK